MTFHRTKSLPFLFCLAFALTLLPLNFANAEQALSGSAACDAGKKQTCVELVQDNILWRISDPDNSASKHWAQENLDNLCSCTTFPYETVNCFQVNVNNNRKTWQEAIAACRARP
jgi:hypothetical protein